jgi:murein DD-endopeptidase MepM/ murein hydrolase activator NlpD
MTRIDQSIAAATVAQAQASPVVSTGSGVLIPFNAPASTSFDQVMQSIGANSSSSSSTPVSAPASSLTPLTPPVSSPSTGATAGGATMGAGSTTGTLGSTASTMGMGATGSTMGMGMGLVTPAAVPGASSSGLGSLAAGLSALAAGLSDLAAGLSALPGDYTGATAATSSGAQGALSTTTSSSADPAVVGAAVQGLGARIQAAASSDNTLAMPFQGSAPLTQAFGPTPYLAEPAYNGYSHFHTGLDYGLPLGTPIDAAAGGTVVAAGWDTTGFGNRVIVDHGNGVRTLYGHLQKVEVQPGAVVTAGQEIGLSGSTGNSSGPHLHFGVEKDGQWVDPAPYLNHNSVPAAPTGASTQPLAPQANAASTGAMGMNSTAGVTGVAGVTGAVTSPGSAGVAPAPGSMGATGTAGSSQTLNPAPVGGGSATGYTPDIPRLIKRVAATTGVSASLISAVIKAESGGDPRAVSRAGAKGLMQLMDATAATYGVTNVFDPLQNLTAGATYLHTLLQRYHGDETLAIAAYNAGPGAVDRYSGIPPYSETQDYVQRVTQYQKEAGQ